MRKIITILLLTLLCYSTAKSQYVNLPDANFRGFLQQKYPSCFNTLGQLDTTCNLVLNEDSLNFSSNIIRNFEGLRYFKNLLVLNLTACYADTIPAFPGSLKKINCELNNLTALPPLPESLVYLDCSQNGSLYSLPSLPDSLRFLLVYTGGLRSLPRLPDSLEGLISSGLYLTNIPALPPTLKALSCFGNQIDSLPQLPHTLQSLECHANNLTSLPPLPASLSYLDCHYNNIFCLPQLPNPINSSSLYIAMDDKIQCIPNHPTGLRVQIYNSFSTIVPPVCNPTNNSNHCSPSPVIQGFVFCDNNNNGVKDANEFYKQNVKFALSNGDYIFSNESGEYKIWADSIGPYTLSVIPPQYYNVVPGNVSFYLTTYDTLVTKDFALQASSIIDGLSIKITPINQAARPGFSFPYLISYENTGTTSLASNIAFDYDQTKLNYNTSSEPGVVDNADNLSYNTGILVPGQSGSFIGYFTLKTTATLGDSLIAGARIFSNAFEAAERTVVIIRGAFDPNDKQATPQLSPSQVANGEYIDYTVRFQNTGTDTAFTVVVSDTLSDDLQTNTLQMLASSHSCKTTVKDNIVFFEFLNILLPDSNVNEPKSHGFVSFKIKPQTTVPENTTITNKAAIYFDYNAPVITNIASTLIKEFTVVPLKLISFSAIPHNDNTTSLYWNTVNEVNTRHFVIERSNDGISFNSVTNVFAKGKANNNYTAVITDATSSLVFYRLKMVDDNGSFTYSPIIKIDKRKNATGLSILRNPVNNFIIISTTDRALSNTQATVINMQGAIVKTFMIKAGSQTIDISDLSTGVYYLRTINGSSKFLKQ